MSAYLDSAYVAKCYLNEPDSLKVRQLVRTAGKAVSSALCIAEVASSMHRWTREGSLTKAQADTLSATFLQDVEQGDLAVLAVSHLILREVERRFRDLPTKVFLRTGDAIHLVSAHLEGFTEIWSSDRHLLAAARFFQLTGRSV